MLGEEELASDHGLSPAAILGREPWGHHGNVSYQKLLSSSPGRPGTARVPTVAVGSL